MSEPGSSVSIDAPRAGWLNRNVVGMTATSFLSDFGHELSTSVLPAFLATLGVAPAALGLIEGVADATASFVKLGSGWITDRLGHRKALAVTSYALTGLSQAIFALAWHWPTVLLGRTLGWFGRGIRGPLRQAMLADSVPAQDRGKAFGFHRAGDTAGAVLGPLLGVYLAATLRGSGHDPTRVFRSIFLLAAVPGALAALVFGILVREPRAAPRPRLALRAALGGLPPGFRRALVGIGLFGLGDFSHTLIVLAAVELLRPRLGAAPAAASAALLYVLHNVTYALAPFPVGAASDRFGRHGLLAIGYLLGAVVSLALGMALARDLSGIGLLAAIFALAGVVSAFVDTLQGALIADLVTPELRGTSYGVLGTVNGIGDLVSSVLVGALWTLHPLWGFGYAALAMAAGAIAVLRVR